MPRLRGFRRACLLVSSALRLLADVTETTTTETSSAAPVSTAWDYYNHNNDDDNVNEENDWAAERILEDEVLTRLPDLTAWADYGDFGTHYNVVIPFRPPLRLQKLPDEATRPRPVVVNQTQQSTSNNQETNSSQINKEVSPQDGEANAMTGDGSAEKPLSDELVREGQTNTTETATGAPEEVATNATATQEGVEEVEETSTSKEAAAEEDDDEAVKSVKFDYASKSAGALILEKSAGWKGASSLLNNDKDRYAIIPCAETSKSVVISLSEDILVKTVMLANYERFSSTVKDFQLLGSQTMGKWVDLGTYTAKNGGGKQEFELYEHSWARYLKVRVLSHYGDEHYLTISQISVFGDTMLQGFHEHWEEEEKDQETLSENEKSSENEANPTKSDVVETAGDDTKSSSEVGGEQSGEGSANPIEISEFADNAPCTDETEVDFTCPKDLSFEQLVFLISSNQSQLEGMSFLDPSYSCRSWTQYEHSHFHGLKIHSVAPVTSIAAETQEDSNESHIISSSDDEASVTIDMTDSPVIAQIQNLIKSTAGIDVGLSKINGLFQGQDANGASEENRASTTPEPVVAEPGDKSTAQNGDRASTPSKEAVSNSREPKEAGGSATMNEEEWAMLLKALERVPSSRCLKEIDFTEFRKKVASSKNGAAGNGNNHSAGGNVELQPIFKRLTDEIKTLQGTLSMQEDFLKSAVGCYQKVLLELVVQQEESRLRADQRLEELEHALETYLMLVGFVEDCISTIVTLVLSVFQKPWYSWLSNHLEHVSDTVVKLLLAITVLVTSQMILFSGWRWIRQRLPLRFSSVVGHGRKSRQRDEADIKVSMPNES